MNTEIKFRAFDDGKMIYQNQLIIDQLWYFFKIVRKDAIILQYTGVKDKNGVEIYNGDIVKGGSRIMQVFWQKEVCQFWLIWKDENASRYEPLTINSAESIGIIGNIYENL